MGAPALLLAAVLAITPAAPELPDAGVEPGGATASGPSVAGSEVMPAPEPAPSGEPETHPAAPSEPAAQAAPEPAPPFTHHVEATGYLSTRGGFARSRINGLVPTDDLPQLTGLVELNGQGKVKYLEQGFASGDLSVLAQVGGMFRGTDLNGKEIDPDRDRLVLGDLDARDIDRRRRNDAATRASVSLNELYVLHEFRPELNVLFGKKRLVWGSGQANNPTDLLNLRKDPTDPTFQRAGAWMARVEVPLETLAFTAVFAPGLLKQTGGIPQQFLTFPAWDRQDDQVHYLAALRAYALIAEADVNLMFFYSNLYGDSFRDKVRLGGSFSRYFFTDYELHTELLLGSGSSRDFVNHDCVTSSMAALACFIAGTPYVAKSRLSDTAITPKLLVGSRRQFDDESLLSVEYLYQDEGLSAAQYQDQVNALDLVLQAKALGVPTEQIPNFNPTPSGDGIPQRFTFDPIGRHYLFITYSKPRIHDDFTAQLVMIANLQDLSTLWSPSLSWSTTEWLTVSAIGFIPAPGLDSLAARRLSNHKPVTEYGNFPVAYRALLEARIFY